jgi:hypothetical protein
MAMLEQTVRRAALVLVVFLLLPACANFSKSGRQQLAYARYVKKMSHNRVRQQTKFKKTKVPTPSLPSAPKEMTGTSDSPLSVSSESSNQ